jgi:heme exporter protein D
MKEFFAMGGYAFYVWMSYGIALIVLIANLVSPLMQRRKLLADIARRQRREKHAASRTGNRRQ